MSTILSKCPRPIFKPQEIRLAGKSHWYVEAEWPDGTLDEIGRFNSIPEAWDWLARQSRAWIQARGRGTDLEDTVSCRRDVPLAHAASAERQRLLDSA